MTAGPPPREAWQAARAGQNTKAQRIGTAIFLLLFAAIAVIVFVITMRGRSVSRPFVQSMYVPDYDQLVAHSPYVQQDIQRIRDLFEPPADSGGNNSAYNEYKLSSGAPLTNQQLQSERVKNFAACKSKDIAIFYIAANGVVDGDGQPGLLSSDRNFNRLDELMSQIQAISASTKLVFIDAGQVSDDYLNGQSVNEFPFAMHRLMAAKSGDKNTYDENFWVINSHGLFQSSRLSHTRSGSVFGVAVSDSLTDFCQNGDPNEPIKLGQLYQSICKRCAAMSMEDDRPAQLPLLMRGGHGIVFYSDLDVRDQAMVQNVIYPRQMIPPPSPEPIAEETPSVTEAKEPGEPPAVADATGEKKEPVEQELTAEETALERIWNLRDRLQNRQLGQGYSPVDFAPQIWLRINDQIVLFDQRQRRGGDPASQEMDDTEKDLKLLVSLMTKNGASNASRYQNNMSDVSARLVAEWNQFVTSTPAGISMNKDVAACRDVYFRSRYYLEWTRIPAFPSSIELQDEFLDLIAELKRIRPLIVNSSIQKTDLESLKASVAKLRIHERQMLMHVTSMVTELNKTATDQSASDIYRKEQIYISLLDSPLLSYQRPFESLVEGSEIDVSRILSRKTLNESFANLLTQKLLPAPAEDSSFQWATDLWIAPNQKNVNDVQGKMKIAQAFLALGDETIRFDALNECQLPDRSRATIQQWEDGVSNCLKILHDSAKKISTTQSEFALSIENSKPGNVQVWPIAILLDKETVHTMAQPLDALFVALPPQIKKIEEPVVVKFDTEGGKIDSSIVNLDQPEAKRQFYFTTTGGDPKSIALQLSIDESEKEFAELLEFASDESGVIELDKPFTFPLDRDTNRELLPFHLTVRSLPTNERQSRKQVGIKLRIVGSDDARVKIANDAALQLMQLTVQLPKEDRVDLIVGSSSFSSYSVSAKTGVDSYIYYDRRANLMAPPNRLRNIDFRLENNSGRKKKFKLELFSVVRPNSFDKTDVLPGQVVGKDVQDPGAITRQLDSLKRATLAKPPFATSKEFELAPDGKDQLDFRPAPVEPKAPAEPAVASDQPAKDAPGQIAPKSEALVDFSNGIYCRLSETDVDLGRQTTREFWFDIKPLPSEELVAATAKFKPLDQLFTIELESRWNVGTPCPVPGGVECVLESGNSQDFAANIVRGLAKLDDKNNRGELQFKISQEELALNDPILLYVNVNKYRGVFIYKLSEADFRGPARTLENLRQDNNFLVLRRIITQTADQAPAEFWKTADFWALKPPDKISFEVLADMDDGSSDECQILLDIKREEWNVPEPQSPRLGDRKIDYLAKINEENGGLDLTAAVNDHIFEWSPDKDVSGKCELTGRVVFAENQTNRATGQTTFKETLHIDGLPPVVDEKFWVIDGVKKDLYPTIKENQKQVQLAMVSSDLAGTKSVQLFVDKDNDPAITDKDGELGTAEPKIGTWNFSVDIEGQLKTQTLQYGENRIYAVLADVLGNKTDITRPIGPFTLTIDKLTDAERAMIAEAKIPKFTLRVRSFRLKATNERILLPDTAPKIVGTGDQEVHFEVKADGKGGFQILKVPPGEYVVVSEYRHRTATGQLQNLRAEKKIIITETEAPEAVELVLEVVKEAPKVP